ncbi:MAG: transketolase [Planctomycetaceae bacterium]|nr:transketolase [Planctomycetaceae bacterium]
MSATSTNLDQLTINTIRTLAMDAVEAANSGHPGTPMALAPVAYKLWNDHLRFNPEAPRWPNRDRFVLSCGHASALIYSLLHLAGVKQFDEYDEPTGEEAVPLEHLKKFRQLHSRCPGHPESYETSGVETTTGPLGQGVANSVGMAIASRWLGAHFNRPSFELFNYNTYALCSDGDLMEGIAGEAASIAGHMKLSNLCWIYDDNKITIEGETELAFSEQVGTRFKGLGWNVITVEDANDLGALDAAYKRFVQNSKRNKGPTLIVVKSVIAWGAPNKANTHGAHGAPLGAEEIRLTKQAYGWEESAQFLVPDEVLSHFRGNVGGRGEKLSKAWDRKFKQYKKQFPELAAEWELMARGELPEGWDSAVVPFPADAKGVASRVSGGKVLNAIASKVPWLIGGSADLAPSTMTMLNFEGAGHFSAHEPGGRNFHFGIREHAMAAACNGMTLSGVRAYCSTFFVFSDYLRPSLRLSAIMKLPVLYIFTHDSIGVGEDGPTHQPVEHLAALRAIPGLITIRPGDANEVAETYRAALKITNHPVAFVLSRQNLPTLDRNKYGSALSAARGGYIVADDAEGQPQVILIATGSELGVTVEAHEKLKAEGVRSRVVSMPSWELFEQQDAAYRTAVLPAGVKARVAVEAGIKFGWERYLGEHGLFVGMTGYGASAPGGTLFKHFGFTADNIATQAKQSIANVG